MNLLLEKETLLDCLLYGKLTVDGQFMWGSNYTFLCKIEKDDCDLTAVYKPVSGELPLWDFPSQTLAGREVAAYLISEAAGWHFVPPTVYREDGPAGAGSVQLFIDHDPQLHYFNFTPQQRKRLRPVVLFDAIINNTDRKGGHILLDADNHLWLIDHGLCFHPEPKLRTVIWDYAGHQIRDEENQLIEYLRQQLMPGQALRKQLDPCLSSVDIKATITRMEQLLENAVFPKPLQGRSSYPWPPV